MTDELHALTAALDALSARVQQAFPDEVTCRRGCDDCCHQQVSMSEVEAARVAETVAALAPAARAALTAGVARATAIDGPDVCGALDDDGGCRIYDGRPVVCRSHGLIYGYRERGASGFARSCALNFRHDAPVPLLRVKPRAPEDASLTHDSDASAKRLREIDTRFRAAHRIGAAPDPARAMTLNELFARLLL